MIAAIVQQLYRSLVADPRVLHHFDPQRLPALEAAQQRWLGAALGGSAGGPVADLAVAHEQLDITDDQVAVVIGHLDAAVHAAGVDDETRRQVIAVVSRLWYARSF